MVEVSGLGFQAERLNLFFCNFLVTLEVCLELLWPRDASPCNLRVHHHHDDNFAACSALNLSVGVLWLHSVTPKLNLTILFALKFPGADEHAY